MLIFPIWMIQSLDKEAHRLEVTRQSIIKMWLAEKLEKKPADEKRAQIRLIASL